MEKKGSEKKVDEKKVDYQAELEKAVGFALGLKDNLEMNVSNKKIVAHLEEIQKWIKK